MSILLEALRKSENSQKPVEPPTIHGNDHHFQEPRTVKSSYVVLLIVIALIVIGWLLWQQYHGNEGGYSPPVELPGAKATKNVPEVPGKTKSVKTKGASGQSEAVVKGQTIGSAAAPPKAAKTEDNRPRTPVEVFKMTTQAFDEMTAEEKAAEREARRAKTAEVRAQRAAKKRAADKRAAESRQKRVLAQQASNQAAAANNKQGGSATAEASAEDTQLAENQNNNDNNASTEPYRSPEPELIGYWELPDSVRRGVPEIKFSVLVYADDPANRFVLVNGERLVEGQQLSPGVEVEQIRREGVVFSYQMYKFFVKR